MGSTLIKIAGTIIRDNKLLLVKSKGKNHYKNPGGVLENNESELEALSREIREEFNAEILTTPEFLLETPATSAMDDPDKSVVIKWYLIEIDLDFNFNYEDEEDFKWFTLTELKSADFEISPQIKTYLIPFLEQNAFLS